MASASRTSTRPASMGTNSHLCGASAMRSARVVRLPFREFGQMSTVNSFGTRTALAVGSRTIQLYSLPALQEAGFPGIARLPYSMKILLENLLRHEDGRY